MMSSSMLLVLIATCIIASLAIVPASSFEFCSTTKLSVFNSTKFVEKLLQVAKLLKNYREVRKIRRAWLHSLFALIKRSN